VLGLDGEVDFTFDDGDVRIARKEGADADRQR
jgi:hypothetical protein